MYSIYLYKTKKQQTAIETTIKRATPTHLYWTGQQCRHHVTRCQSTNVTHTNIKFHKQNI